MASIEKRTRNGQVRWYARYRDPAGKQRTRTFDRRLDAERFLTKIEASKLVGSYVDPKQAARTFRDFAEQHWAAYSHTLAADTTRPRKRSRARPAHPAGARRRSRRCDQAQSSIGAPWQPGRRRSRRARSGRRCDRCGRSSTPRSRTV